MSTDRPVVFLACPSYGGFSSGAMQAILSASKEATVCVRIRKPCSLLALEFNNFWCEALNLRQQHGITHFAMIHADVQAEEWWLDKLLEIGKTLSAPIVSTVIPIKDTRGLTSTAVHSNVTKGFRRLTMTEVYDLPETFSLSDVSFAIPEDILAINTGLWLVDFRKPWVESVHFEIRDNIVKDKDGKFQPRNLPEDWHFSIQAAQLGIRAHATRAVKVKHLGGSEYPNEYPWGDMVRDDG